jgi:hypothetical protein
VAFEVAAAVLGGAALLGLFAPETRGEQPYQSIDASADRRPQARLGTCRQVTAREEEEKKP